MTQTIFTKAFVSQEICPAGQAKKDYFDQQCRGLMLEVRPTGRKTYYIRYIDQRGKQRQHRIGDARDITVAQARQAADQLRSKVALGEDISQAKKDLKQVLTVSEYIHSNYLPFVESYKRSWKCDKGLLSNHIEPIWGKRYLDQISKSDVISLMAKHRETHAPGSCNRLLILLRYLFSLAKKWELHGITKNPTEGIPLMKEDNKRERFLSSEEAQHLFSKVNTSVNPMLKFIIPMLILTGARKREVLDARWEDFDFDRRQWRIHTTKLGRPRYVPMSDGVITLLNSMPKHQCVWVFPNPKTLKPYESIYNSWNTARKQSGLKEVRIHDLRHSYASFLVNSGRSLYEVQMLLGHTQVKTTQRYAHLSHDTLLDATNSVNTALSGFFMPTQILAPTQIQPFQ
jgi:integrase